MCNDTICNINRLPLGLLEFSNIRNKNKIYVDKTKLIYKIANQDAPIFFSRPRRFGKSLLINTLSCLFKKGVEYFHGLDIEKLWSDTTYNVVHFDFSRMAGKNVHDLKFVLSAKIISEFRADDTLIQNNSPKLQYPDLILDEILSKINNNSTIFLVDEYDAPLTHHINDPDELKGIMEVLNDFYATIKQYTDKFRLIFITGVTRSSHISIFSAFNNLIDISLNDEFNTLLGFTKDDLIKYFDIYVENSSRILNINRNDLYQRIEQYYDGYQFSINAKEALYNPWSILNFFKNSENGFINYWFDSGGTSSIIMNYLKIKENFDFLDYNSREIIVDKYTIGSKYEITNIPYNVLLYQAGYFTIRKIDEDIARLVVANKEVEESLYRLYLISNNLSPKDELREKMIFLSSAIDKKDLSTIVKIFNKILNECVSCLSRAFNDERSIRDIIYAALTYIPSLRMIKEHDFAKGNSDLEIFTKKTCLVIEFKRTYPKKRSADEALTLAINQIKNNRYGISFSSDYTLYRVAMVISTEEKIILPFFCKEVL